MNLTYGATGLDQLCAEPVEARTVPFDRLRHMIRAEGLAVQGSVRVMRAGPSKRELRPSRGSGHMIRHRGTCS